MINARTISRSRDKKIERKKLKKIAYQQKTEKKVLTGISSANSSILIVHHCGLHRNFSLLFLLLSLYFPCFVAQVQDHGVQDCIFSRMNSSISESRPTEHEIFTMKESSVKFCLNPRSLQKQQSSKQKLKVFRSQDSWQLLKVISIPTHPFFVMYLPGRKTDD